MLAFDLSFVGVIIIYLFPGTNTNGMSPEFMARVAKMEARLAKIEMNELTLATRFTHS